MPSRQQQHGSGLPQPDPVPVCLPPGLLLVQLIFLPDGIASKLCRDMLRQFGRFLRKPSGITIRRGTDKAVEIAPTDKTVLNARGNARRQDGDLTGAIADLTSAIAVAPNYVTAWINRATAKQRCGDFTTINKM